MNKRVSHSFFPWTIKTLLSFFFLEEVEIWLVFIIPLTFFFSPAQNQAFFQPQWGLSTFSLTEWDGRTFSTVTLYCLLSGWVLTSCTKYFPRIWDCEKKRDTSGCCYFAVYTTRAKHTCNGTDQHQLVLSLPAPASHCIWHLLSCKLIPTYTCCVNPHLQLWVELELTQWVD